MGLIKCQPHLIQLANNQQRRKNGFIFILLSSTIIIPTICDWILSIMGARTNYTIVTTDNPEQNINIYAHWDGDYGVAKLQKAIQSAMPRIKMGDIAYAARIILDQITAEGRDSETGYGIYMGSEIYYEEEYESKEVNLVKGTVTVGSMSFSIDQFMGVNA